MNILIACNGKYLDYSRYLLASLRKYNGLLNVYLIYENIEDNILNAYKKFISDFDIGELNLIHFDSSTIELPLKNDEITGHITKEAYFRLYAPFFLPEDMDRILYLDSDIVCTGDISSFYNTDFIGNLLVGCQNVDISNGEFSSRLGLPEDTFYFNSGVLIFNLKKYREEVSIDKLNEFISENASILLFQDQDVVNKMFYGKIFPASIDYNFQIAMLLYTDGGILHHYTGPIKPWDDDYARPLLAWAYYDAMKMLGLNDEYERQHKIHVNNFINGSKLATIAVLGDVVTEDLVNYVVNQDESNIEILIAYNEISDDVINKFSYDCRVKFVTYDELEILRIDYNGKFFAYFNIEDFIGIDKFFLKELCYFCDYNGLTICFTNTFNNDCNESIEEVSEVLSEDKIYELIDKNGNYKYMVVINPELYGCKVGYRIDA